MSGKVWEEDANLLGFIKENNVKVRPAESFHLKAQVRANNMDSQIKAVLYKKN